MNCFAAEQQCFRVFRLAAPTLRMNRQRLIARSPAVLDVAQHLVVASSNYYRLLKTTCPDIFHVSGAVVACARSQAIGLQAGRLHAGGLLIATPVAMMGNAQAFTSDWEFAVLP